MRIGLAGVFLVTLGALGCATLPDYTPANQVVLADQGWTPTEREQFYHTSQGTLLLPRSWLLALEQPGISLEGASRFAAADYLARFGFIPSERSQANPDGLPVGFATDTVVPADGAPRAEVVVGLSCAACHTGQVEYKGRAVRIDGGPAMADLGTFQSQMGLALFVTLNSDVRFARFARRVLASEGVPDTEDARAELKQRLGAGIERGAAEARDNLYPVAEGYGRLDALGRGGNFLFGLSLRDPRNLAVADGPVSFPALWDAPWFDWVQYNGAIRQPLARNVAEALGVRSVATLIGSDAERYVSSVRVDKIARMEGLLAGDRPGSGLRAPRWPEAVLGPIDRPVAERGAARYAALCAGCHDARVAVVPAGADGPGTPARQEIVVKMVPLSEIGTDPKAAANFAARRMFVAPGSDQTLSAAQGLQDVTGRVTQRWFERNAVPEAARRQMTGDRRNEWRAPLAYRARSLEGIWATAPYLHNGSVPTLSQMLLPAERRDAVFHTGSKQFDPVAVGFETTPFRGSFRFDTGIPGNLNRGHSFGGAPGAPGVIGPELTETERRELLEYLKTL